MPPAYVGVARRRLRLGAAAAAAVAVVGVAAAQNALPRVGAALRVVGGRSGGDPTCRIPTTTTAAPSVTTVDGPAVDPGHRRGPWRRRDGPRRRGQHRTARRRRRRRTTAPLPGSPSTRCGRPTRPPAGPRRPIPARPATASRRRPPTPPAPAATAGATATTATTARATGRARSGSRSGVRATPRPVAPPKVSARATAPPRVETRRRTAAFRQSAELGGKGRQRALGRRGDVVPGEVVRRPQAVERGVRGIREAVTVAELVEASLALDRVARAGRGAPRSTPPTRRTPAASGRRPSGGSPKPGSSRSRTENSSLPSTSTVPSLLSCRGRLTSSRAPDSAVMSDGVERRHAERGPSASSRPPRR